MASPESEADRVDSVSVEGEGREGGVEEQGGGGGDDDPRRIGPWHPPDYKRQLKLATRLSNPEYRSTRSARSAVVRSGNVRYPPGETSNGYPGQRPHTTSSGYRNKSNLLDSRLSTDPALLNSPLNVSRRRPWTSTATGRMSNGSSSPRRGPSTPRGHVAPARQPPLYSTSSDRTVSSEELTTIIDRVTRPTVASRGGVDIMHKDFTYIQQPRLKTLPVIPGLDRRYMGLQHVSRDHLNDIVSRLTRMTSAYEAKFAQNRNVWVDMEPGAHLVKLRKGQTV